MRIALRGTVVQTLFAAQTSLSGQQKLPRFPKKLDSRLNQVETFFHVNRFHFFNQIPCFRMRSSNA